MLSSQKSNRRFNSVRWHWKHLLIINQLSLDYLKRRKRISTTNSSVLMGCISHDPHSEGCLGHLQNLSSPSQKVQLRDSVIKDGHRYGRIKSPFLNQSHSPFQNLL